jgi:saccharopine dehydrogenase-like NADP-dependent oxidoreductase
MVLILLLTFYLSNLISLSGLLGKHFVTASYVSDDMRKLHAAAISKGVVLLNEVGLDPGIDHMVSWHAMS